MKSRSSCPGLVSSSRGRLCHLASHGRTRWITSYLSHSTARSARLSNEMDSGTSRHARWAIRRTINNASASSSGSGISSCDPWASRKRPCGSNMTRHTELAKRMTLEDATKVLGCWSRSVAMIFKSPQGSRETVEGCPCMFATVGSLSWELWWSEADTVRYGRSRKISLQQEKRERMQGTDPSRRVVQQSPQRTQARPYISVVTNAAPSSLSGQQCAHRLAARAPSARASPALKNPIPGHLAPRGKTGQSTTTTSEKPLR